ncbi:MAG: ribonuclease domain-containing protein [Coriobacteriales bacterium]|nr:ribonuclease domain-containing protein [Coriobacteriales bacterium]
MRRKLWTLLAVLTLVLGVLALPACAKGAGSEQAATQEQAAQEPEAQEEPAQKESAKEPAADQEQPAEEPETTAGAAIDENGTYTSKEDVALYIHTYGHLPSNFVTKDEAEDAGWKTEGLSLDEACPGKSIGGDRFGNREGKLPKKKGRTWYECDIDYHGQRSRGPKRIVYSSDGLVYYTEDHYQTFEQLY